MAAFRLLGRASVATLGASSVGVGALFVNESVSPESGVSRSFRFWRNALPIYAHYKYVESQLAKTPDVSPEHITATYKPLNDRYAPMVERLTLDLRGFYFKLAQIMSTRDEFLPLQYVEWTKKLQDKSPNVLPSEEIKRIVEASLDVDVDHMFSEWQDEPIGAASVAQVHRAVLRETGEVVAVKVQYPGVEQQFRSDIDTVETFCKYLQPQHVPFFKEIKKQFATEFDARGEAENLREVRDNIYNAGWNTVVDVPKPIAASKDVLVMSYLPGVKMVDGVRDGFRKIAEMQGKELEELEEEQRRMLESGELKRLQVSDNMKQTQRISTIVKTRDWLMNKIIWLGNNTVRYIDGGEWKYWDTPIPLNLGRILDVLVRVHGHEIFFDGAFNGDPHPGNILLMPDGRLGLVDYGQVKRMTLEDRIVYAKLVIALARDDRAEVVRLARDEMRSESKFKKDDITFRYAAFFHDRDDDEITLGKNVSEFMEWMEAEDPIIKVDDEFVMVGRVSVLLRGMANAFGMRLRMTNYWRKQAEEFLRQNNVEY